MTRRCVLYAGEITRLDPTAVVPRAPAPSDTPSSPGATEYVIVDGRVRYHAVLDGADPATFRTLGHLFARDARHVYFDGGIVANADPETFVVLATATGCGWARDRERVWHRRYEWSDHWDGETLREVVGADAASFEALDDSVGRDASSVWRGLARIAGAEPASFRVLGHGWARDAARLWYRERRIAADPDSLSILGDHAVVDLDDPELDVLGDGYARAGDQILFAGFTVDASPDARSLGGGYLVDAHGACHHELATASLKFFELAPFGGRLEGADPASLRREGGFAVDRTSVFFGSTRLEARASTFRALDRHHGTDGHVAYFDATRIDGAVERLRPLGGRYAPRGHTLATLDTIADAWASDGVTLFLQGRPVWDRCSRYLTDDREAALRQLVIPALTLLDPWWATDGNLILRLLDGEVIEAAHAPSFEALGDGYARDISRVWAGTERLAADPASFRVLGDGYARDATRTWFRGHLLDDAGELRVLGGGWACDARGVLCGATRVAADPASFVVVGAATAAEGAWDPRQLELDDPLWIGERAAVGRDLERLWWGTGSTPITAVAIGHGYAVDEARVWHAGRELEADASTFVALGGGYARDALRAYFHDRVTR